MLQDSDNWDETKPSFCFICDTAIECSKFHGNDCESSKVQLSRLFCSIVSRYLDLKLFEVKARRTISFDEDADELDCCDSCSVIVKTVCELYDQFKNLQLYLDWNLEKIGEIMKRSNQSTNHQLGCNQMESKGFKREFMDNVESIKQSQYPHLKLDKITPSREQVQNVVGNQNVKLETYNDSNDDHHDEEDFLWNHDPEEGCEAKMDLQLEIGETFIVKAENIEENNQGETKIKRRRRRRTDEPTGAEDIFACAFCDERYETKESLYQHERRRHQGEKLYPCRICGERFSKMQERKAHHLAHKVVKYKCRFCTKSFPKSKYRIRHEWTHTGLKPFLCSVCERKFNDSSSARRHVQSQHKNVDNAQVVKCFSSYSDFKVTGTNNKVQK